MVGPLRAPLSAGVDKLEMWFTDMDLPEQRSKT